MALLRWQPLESRGRFGNLEASEMHEEANQASFTWQPLTDIVEKDDRYSILLEIPGVKKEDVKLTVENNMLTVKGEKQRELEVSEKHYYRVERKYGAFQRMFRLSEKVNAEKISAKYNDGILEVVLEKKVPEKPKQIEVKVK